MVGTALARLCPPYETAVGSRNDETAAITVRLSCPGRAAAYNAAAQSRDPESCNEGCGDMGPGSAAHRRRGAAPRPGHETWTDRQKTRRCRRVLQFGLAP